MPLLRGRNHPEADRARYLMHGLCPDWWSWMRSRIGEAGDGSQDGAVHEHTWIVGDTFVRRFSVADSVIRFTGTTAFVGTDEFFGRLSDAVVTDFNTYLISVPRASWPPFDDTPGSALFQVPIFWLEQRTARMAVLRLPFRKLLQVELAFTPGQDENELRPSAFGNSRVWSEVVEGKRPEFDDLRRDVEILDS